MAGEIARRMRPPTLLLLEHPPTFTFGRRGKAANLLWDEAELARQGIRTYWVDRGGDVTYHGPGQLVGYPLLQLRTNDRTSADVPAGRIPQADYIGYLRKLEQVLILALAALGVTARAEPGLTGVWVDMPGTGKSKKMAAIGVKVDAQGVSRHGFALNVSPNMRHWDGIIACGLQGYEVTSLAQVLPASPSMPAVRADVMNAFQSVFGLELRVVVDAGA
jgi:lipoate-protein ligase B